MLKFELSKLIDYIDKYGKCTIKIKVNDKILSEIDLCVNEDGSFNLSDDEIKQLIAILYGEIYSSIKVEDKQTTIVEDYFKNKLVPLKNAIIVLDSLMLYGGTFEAFVVEPEEKINRTKEGTNKLIQWIAKMVLYTNPVKDDTISIMAIYNGLGEALKKDDIYQGVSIDVIIETIDKHLIPQRVNDNLQFIIQSRNMEKTHVKIMKGMDILIKLQELVETNSVSDEAINEILEKNHYETLLDESKKIIDKFIRDIKDKYNNGENNKML